ncbi:MAG: manganese efflux pump, partial [Candidatus Brocadiaceae bacterium]
DAGLGFETDVGRQPSRGLRLLGLAVATSIDALAVGISLAMLRVAVWWPAAWIGIVTGALCVAGIQAGDRAGRYLGRYAEVCGGAVLCLIGVRILFVHLTGAP